MLLVLILSLVGLGVRLLFILAILSSAIVVFCSIGADTVRSDPFAIYTVVAFGLFGYFIRFIGCEAIPILLGVVIGPMLQEYLRRALVMSRGSPAIFAQNYLSFASLLISAEI